MSDRIVPRQRRLKLTPEGLTSIQTLYFKPYATLHCRMNDVHWLSFNRTCPEGRGALHLVNKSRHLYRSNVVTSFYCYGICSTALMAGSYCCSDLAPRASSCISRYRKFPANISND